MRHGKGPNQLLAVADAVAISKKPNIAAHKHGMDGKGKPERQRSGTPHFTPPARHLLTQKFFVAVAIPI